MGIPIPQTPVPSRRPDLLFVQKRGHARDLEFSVLQTSDLSYRRDGKNVFYLDKYNAFISGQVIILFSFSSQNLSFMVSQQLAKVRVVTSSCKILFSL